MSFLAIIIALVLVQLWGSADRLHHDDWFARWRERAVAWQVPPWLALTVVLAVPVAAVALLLDAVRPLLFGLVWIALASAVLLYALGRGDFHAMMAHYRSQCHSGDFEGAYLTARTRFGWEVDGEEPGSTREAHTFMQRGFTYEALQRWFAVIFYFALLGPAAALAYRLLQLRREGTGRPVGGRGPAACRGEPGGTRQAGERRRSHSLRRAGVGTEPGAGSPALTQCRLLGTGVVAAGGAGLSAGGPHRGTSRDSC